VCVKYSGGKLYDSEIAKSERGICAIFWSMRRRYLERFKVLP
jgi:hypothetical protein